MSQDKIGYALWMVRSAAKQSAVSTTSGISMMAIGWIMLCHAAFGVHKPEEKLSIRVIKLGKNTQLALNRLIYRSIPDIVKDVNENVYLLTFDKVHATA